MRENETSKLVAGWTACPLALMRKAPWNYKKDDEHLLGKLKANIKKNGLIENILVREVSGGYEVVNGNHRFQALLEIGYDSPVQVFNLGKISELEAKRIAIETNETRFDSDKLALDTLIQEVLASNDATLYETLPYSNDYLDVLCTVSSEASVAAMVDATEVQALKDEEASYSQYTPLPVYYLMNMRCSSNDILVAIGRKFQELGIRTARIEGAGLIHEADDLLAFLESVGGTHDVSSQ